MTEPTTSERVKQAEPILDRYTEQLHLEKEINTYALEFELRESWNIGYQTLKRVMIDILKNIPEYHHLAAYYAEFSNQSMNYKLARPFYEEDPDAMCVIGEFKRPLAKLYGASTWHHDQSLAEKRRLYWLKAFQATKALPQAVHK